MFISTEGLLNTPKPPFAGGGGLGVPRGGSGGGKLGGSGGIGGVAKKPELKRLGLFIPVLFSWVPPHEKYILVLPTPPLELGPPE